MTISVGLDIGGTKIAAAAFDAQGAQIAQSVLPTPRDYPAFLAACGQAVAQLEKESPASIGLSLTGNYDGVSGLMLANANMPFLVGQALGRDLASLFRQEVVIENDANCAALAEAVDGAGQGAATMFGLIMGTGVAGGYVVNGRIVVGANGLAGEIGHLPLPYYEPEDGDLAPCGCGQCCLEKLICGDGLARLYAKMTGNRADARQVARLAGVGDDGALRVLDRYYTVVAKAMTVVLHSFDPEVIAVSGGLNGLPGLYDEVPRRWGRYAVAKKPKTRFVPAQHGAMAGLRGAAALGRTIRSDSLGASR